MEILLDKLVAGSICPEEVCVFQREEVPNKRKAKQADIMEVNSDLKKKVKGKKFIGKVKDAELLHSIKEKMAEKQSHENLCLKCPMLQNEAEMLLNENMAEDKEIQELKISNDALTKKYTNLKEKYKSLKTKYKSAVLKSSFTSNEQSRYVSEVIVLGSTLSVETYRLGCCRISDYSTFTRDLLDIVLDQKYSVRLY